MTLAPVNEDSRAYMIRVSLEGGGHPVRDAGGRGEVRLVDVRRRCSGPSRVTWGSISASSWATRRALTGDGGPLCRLRGHSRGDRGDGRLLRESLEAGGLGFSTSEAETHTDMPSRPIASRTPLGRSSSHSLGSPASIEGTKLEYVPTIKGFTDKTREWFADLSVAANRALDFPLLMDVQPRRRANRRLFQCADVARARGGEVLPQVTCQAEPYYYNLRSGFALRGAARTLGRDLSPVA